MQVIGHIRTDFPEKFGIPRQSGLVDTVARIEFLPAYRDPEALRGIDGYSHLWLVWVFSEAVRDDGSWTATVRPPRLGGNKRMGVFATRSPYRPNPIGLSSVRLIKVATDSPQGPILYVAGADLLDGTPILDVKPYLAYTDAHPEAESGFAFRGEAPLTVEFPPVLFARIPAEHRQMLSDLLAQDPRPGYQNNPDRVYKMGYAGFDVHFTVDGDRLCVVDVKPYQR